ncbi:MAG: signal peptidase I, partial [Candidatus Eremiobacteraeota bacterium]|nr:signal peptidase I [Candidatus Eremiobacteraeota bacterium]
ISVRPGSPVAPGTGEPRRTPSWRTVVREYLDAFIVAGLVALFLITFVVRTFFIPSASMEPTLQIHDVLLVNEFEYRFRKPQHGDIVVFTPPIPSSSDFIKRLIGAPGDTLRVHEGVVYRNGQAVNEPYIKDRPAYELEIKNYGIYVNDEPVDPMAANIPPRSAWQAPDRIPNGYYFMMGDNRNNSDDSHYWGFAQLGGTFAAGPLKGHKAGFTGHAFVLFWPLDRARILH